MALEELENFLKNQTSRTGLGSQGSSKLKNNNLKSPSCHRPLKTIKYAECYENGHYNNQLIALVAISFRYLTEACSTTCTMSLYLLTAFLSLLNNKHSCEGQISPTNFSVCFPFPKIIPDFPRTTGITQFASFFQVFAVFPRLWRFV